MNEKTAIIIGGTGQIGQYIMEAVLKEGYNTVCISQNKVKEEVKKTFIDYYTFDMSTLEGIEKCHDLLSKKYVSADVLVNVIGKNNVGSLDEITEEMWNEVIDTNLKSIFFICRAFRGLLKKSGGSTIINFSSTAGIRAFPKSPHYVAAKAGVIALTEYFSQVFAPDIRVNCIAPGIVMTDNHKPNNYSDYYEMENLIPLHRLTTPEELAEAVVFLMRSTTITGHTLVVDGGLTLKVAGK